MTKPTELPQERSAQFAATPDDRTICFADWGEREGQPVIWLHGTPGCRLPSRSWVEYGVVDVLHSLGVRLVTYDRPGYGRSGRHRGRRIVDSASDAAAVADAAGIDRFAVGGGSGGTAHALAAAAILKDRVTRVALTAPMGPYTELGPKVWSQGQDDDIREYVGWCVEGEDRIAIEFARMDSEMREAGSPDDLAQAATFERTRSGIWGWVDDELAVVKPWDFDPGTIEVPAEIWYDPQESVLPRQHAEWVARTVPDSRLITTSALGHRQVGDPKQDWIRLFSWLVAGHGL